MKQYHWSFATLDGTGIWSGLWTNCRWNSFCGWQC